MKTWLCKGCGSPIIVGQLRRGDTWHSECFNKAEAIVTGPRVRRPTTKTPRGLTQTQHFILDEASCSPTGSVVFARGDRKGTRCAGVDNLDRPIIVAYSNPEYFLLRRGLLQAGNEPHVYCITDAGRAALRGAL